MPTQLCMQVETYTNTQALTYMPIE